MSKYERKMVRKSTREVEKSIMHNLCPTNRASNPFKIKESK